MEPEQEPRSWNGSLLEVPKRDPGVEAIFDTKPKIASMVDVFGLGFLVYAPPPTKKTGT